MTRPHFDYDGAPISAADTSTLGVAQLVLAEKRTSLAVLRTGMTLGLLPLSVTTVLVTLSRYYEWLENLHFLVPMYVVLTGMTAGSLYLIGRSCLKLRHYDRLLDAIRRNHPALAGFLQ